MGGAPSEPFKGKRPPPTPSRTALTMAIGLAGALIAVWVNLPAGALIGAAIATSAAAWSGLHPCVDQRLRDGGFLIIGLSLGSGFEAGVMDQAGDWLFSLAMLCASVIVTTFGGRWLLMRFWRKDGDTALLSVSPGALSLALLLAEDSKAEITTVVIMQAMRLLILAAVLPVMLSALGATGDGSAARAGEALSPLVLALLGLCGMALSLLLKRGGLPAAFLIGGMAVSAAAHLTGLVHGAPPVWAIFAGFWVAGSNIGSQFSGISLRSVFALLKATLASVGLAAAFAGVFAIIVASVTGMPAGQVWIAFAPGGVEAMAAISLAMNYDPAYVALHHLIRIGFLITMLPVLLHHSRKLKH